MVTIKDKLPYTTEELIECLDKQFPHKCPSIHETEREIFMYSGMRHLIDILKNELEQRNKDILNNS